MKNYLNYNRNLFNLDLIIFVNLNEKKMNFFNKLISQKLFKLQFLREVQFKSKI